jgi:hypothetical protein
MFEKVNLLLSLFINTVVHLDTTTRNQHLSKLRLYPSFSPAEIGLASLKQAVERPWLSFCPCFVISKINLH